ncbi:unnamed protein product [Echinostoma caproni]|uniref:Flocculation protein FLO11-like n=1 Tax=Echinostoma caproni TaxID=27848 RepID=A0A183B3S1_9TREM|nr:unnamed protein product [Echinostoma caproni]
MMNDAEIHTTGAPSDLSDQIPDTKYTYDTRFKAAPDIATSLDEEKTTLVISNKDNDTTLPVTSPTSDALESSSLPSNSPPVTETTESGITEHTRQTGSTVRPITSTTTIHSTETEYKVLALVSDIIVPGSIIQTEPESVSEGLTNFETDSISSVAVNHVIGTSTMSTASDRPHQSTTEIDTDQGATTSVPTVNESQPVTTPTSPASNAFTEQHDADKHSTTSSDAQLVPEDGEATTDRNFSYTSNNLSHIVPPEASARENTTTANNTFIHKDFQHRKLNHRLNNLPVLTTQTQMYKLIQCLMHLTATSPPSSPLPQKST